MNNLDPAAFGYQWIRSDGGTDTDISGATSSVTTTNNRPTFTEGATAERSVPENSASDVNVGGRGQRHRRRQRRHADSGDTLTSTLGGTDAASWDIVSSTGQIRPKTGVTCDLEDTTRTDPTYAVTVTVDDGNSGTDTIDITIKVDNVEELSGKPGAPRFDFLP